MWSFWVRAGRHWWGSWWRPLTTVPPASTEVRRIASTEARRLKRIPSQNAEHGIVRNYVHTSTFFSLYSHVLPDLRWRSLLPLAQMEVTNLFGALAAIEPPSMRACPPL